MNGLSQAERTNIHTSHVDPHKMSWDILRMADEHEQDPMCGCM